jgi:hypothetical protein
MLWRLAARILTGPLAFFAAWLIDLFAYALSARRERRRRRNASIGA